VTQPPGKGFARPETGAAFLATLADSWRRRPRLLACLAAKPRKVKDYSDGALAVALRQSLTTLAAARLAGEGQQTQMEMIYRYLTGPRFRHRIEAVVERFADTQADLGSELSPIFGDGLIDQAAAVAD
jgi:hypothetical protein